MGVKIGDLCWAKMKGYPLWPGKILNGPDSERKHKKKMCHYLYFFGSSNYAWVEAKNIKPNSEEIIKHASRTKWLPLRKAIQQLKSNMAEENYYRQGIVKKCQVKIERFNLDNTQLEESNSLTLNEALSLESCRNKSIEPHTNMAEENYYRQAIVKECQVKIERLNPDNTQVEESNSLTQNEALSLESRRKRIIEPHTNLETESLIDDEGGKLSKCQKMMPKKFGFIGHGEIGKEIIKNLLKSKCDVTIWSQTSIEYGLSDEGKHTADSFVDLIDICDIILCYTDSEDSARSFLNGEEGILQSFAAIKPCDAKGFALLANIDLKESADTAADIQANGARYIEAHFIGSQMHAIKGELLILCSGDQSLFLDCKAAFVSFQRVKYLGPEIAYAPKFHTIMGVFLNSISKSYKDITSLIKTFELPLPIFHGLLKTVFDESYLTTLFQAPVEKRFDQVDRIRFFLEELRQETLIAINFPTEDDQEYAEKSY